MSQYYPTILAFETSCDDTAVAVIHKGVEVLSQVKESQPQHQIRGGVVPEIAARLHAENWRPVLEKSLLQAQIKMPQIDAIACTAGPGLSSSLLTGTTVASFISQHYQKPLLPVQHIYGHLGSVFLERGTAWQDAENFPMLTLTISGGHTSLYLGTDIATWECLGTTRDDAAGEAFDKVAKMLGLPYPGGPIVSEKAFRGNPERFVLPIPQLGKHSLEFSFSGLKAAVRRHLETLGIDPNGSAELPTELIADLSASFQATMVKIFQKKLQTALRQHSEIRRVSLVGGVSANLALRSGLEAELQFHGLRLWTPKQLAYCTDNAAMIGAGAYFGAMSDMIRPVRGFCQPRPKWRASIF